MTENKSAMKFFHLKNSIKRVEKTHQARGYSYRQLADIQKAIQEPLATHECFITASHEVESCGGDHRKIYQKSETSKGTAFYHLMEEHGGGVYAKVSLKVICANTGDVIASSFAMAKEDHSRSIPGSNSSQLSGSAATYAAKRAYEMLFDLETDTLDADQISVLQEGGKSNPAEASKRSSMIAAAKSDPCSQKTIDKMKELLEEAYHRGVELKNCPSPPTIDSILRLYQIPSMEMLTEANATKILHGLEKRVRDHDKNGQSRHEP